ncbi:MAG: serine protease [Candidatus Obscuribacterales bacterium]|nr:serine protease [Candidatus Obscuribacterales bacterium]
MDKASETTDSKVNENKENSDASKNLSSAVAEEMFDKYKGNVVNIVAYHAHKGKEVFGSAGSGFFVKESGYKGPERCEFATSNHVINPEKQLDLSRLEITLDDGSRYSAKVLRQDKAHDLAILKLEGVNEPEKVCKSLPLADREPSDGEEMIRLNRTRWETDFRYGKFLEQTNRNKQTLPELDGEDINRRMLAFDHYHNVSHNFSGGPYINSKGEIMAQHEGGQANKYSLATPAADIAVELKNLHSGK